MKDFKKYQKNIHDPYKRLRLRKIAQMGIEISVVSMKPDILSLSLGGKERFLYNNSFKFNRESGLKLSKNKDLTKKILGSSGIKTPHGIVVRKTEGVLRKLKKAEIDFPVTLKPIGEKGGSLVYPNVKTPADLLETAKRMAKSLKGCKKDAALIIEKYIEGADFRILVLDGKVISCIERTPAHVIGNGKNNVLELIKIFNKKRHKLTRIVVDEDVKKILSEKGLTLRYVPRRKERVYLQKVSNISKGGTATDKSREISGFYKKIAIDSAKALGLRFAGVDLITNDISSKSRNYAVIEVNGDPGIFIHERPFAKGGPKSLLKILITQYFK